ILTVSTDLGTVVSPDLDPNYAGVQVQADAAGQFTLQVRRPTRAGTATITGTDAPRAQTRRPPEQDTPPTRRPVDFNSPVSPTMDPVNPGDPNGYRGVLPTDVYSAGQGFGWLSGVQGGFDRGTLVAGPANKILRDGHFGGVSTPGLFRADLPPGT